MSKSVSLLVAYGLLSEFINRYLSFVRQDDAGREGGLGRLMICRSLYVATDQPTGPVLRVFVDYFEDSQCPASSWIHVPSGEFTGARDCIALEYVENESHNERQAR